MIFTIVTISLCILFLAMLSAYPLVKVPMRYSLKFLLIPSVFVVAFILGTTIPKLSGQPYAGYPEKEFMYMGHKINGSKINLWTAERDGHGGMSMHLYEFDFNGDIQAKLNAALAAAQKGQMVIGKFHGQGKNGLLGFSNNLSSDDAQLEIKEPGVTAPLPPKHEGNTQ